MSCGSPGFIGRIEECLRGDYRAGNIDKVAYVAVNINSAVFLVTNEVITESQLVEALKEVHWNHKANVREYEFRIFNNQAIKLMVVIVDHMLGVKGKYAYATMTADDQVVGEEKVA